MDEENGGVAAVLANVGESGHDDGHLGGAVLVGGVKLAEGVEDDEAAAVEGLLVRAVGLRA